MSLFPPLRKIPNSNPMGTVERGRPTSWNTVLLNQLSALSTTIFGHNNFTSAVLKSEVGLHIHGTQMWYLFILTWLLNFTEISVCQCNRQHAIDPQHRHHISIKAIFNHVTDKTAEVRIFLNTNVRFYWKNVGNMKSMETSPIIYIKHCSPHHSTDQACICSKRLESSLISPWKRWEGTIKQANTASFKFIPIFRRLISECGPGSVVVISTG